MYKIAFLILRSIFLKLKEKVHVFFSFFFREWVPAKAPDLPEGWTALIEAEKQKKDIRSIVLPSHTNTDEIVKRFDFFIFLSFYFPISNLS